MKQDLLPCVIMTRYPAITPPAAAGGTDTESLLQTVMRHLKLIAPHQSSHKATVALR